MSLKDEILDSCKICKGSGWSMGSACACLLRFRVWNRMINSGFSKRLISIVDKDDYQLPIIEEGQSFVEFFLANSNFVEENGLGLFLYSQDKGRGKTTLAHKLILEASKGFVSKDTYSTRRTYAFQHVEDLLKAFKDGKDDSWMSTWYVLDDLGNEDRNTEWKRNLFLTSIQKVIHYRRDKQLPTILTSNYRPADLSMIYKGELDSLLEIHPSGELGGVLYRSVRVGGPEDLRLLHTESVWPV